MQPEKRDSWKMRRRGQFFFWLVSRFAQARWGTIYIRNSKDASYSFKKIPNIIKPRLFFFSPFALRVILLSLWLKPGKQAKRASRCRLFKAPALAPAPICQHSQTWGAALRDPRLACDCDRNAYFVCPFSFFFWPFIFNVNNHLLVCLHKSCCFWAG